MNLHGSKTIGEYYVKRVTEVLQSDGTWIQGYSKSNVTVPSTNTTLKIKTITNKQTNKQTKNYILKHTIKNQIKYNFTDKISVMVLSCSLGHTTHVVVNT